jgi:hypothetical protein
MGISNACEGLTDLPPSIGVPGKREKAQQKSRGE